MFLCNLQTKDIRFLYDTIEHHLDQEELGTIEYERMEIILDYLKPHIHNNNIEWQLHAKETVPQTADNILNDLVRQAISHEPGSELYIFYEFQVWSFLEERYNFNPDDHPLERTTFEEAIQYAVAHIEQKQGHFYNEEIAIRGF